MVNVSQESGAFFQTDAEIAKQREKQAKYNYTEGDAIQLSTKALNIHLSQDEKYVYVAESGFFVRKISLAVSVLMEPEMIVSKKNFNRLQRL
jgi:hypothetical protein